jgi:hypothetical protein
MLLPISKLRGMGPTLQLKTQKLLKCENHGVEVNVTNKKQIDESSFRFQQHSIGLLHKFGTVMQQ